MTYSIHLRAVKGLLIILHFSKEERNHFARGVLISCFETRFKSLLYLFSGYPPAVPTTITYSELSFLPRSESQTVSSVHSLFSCNHRPGVHSCPRAKAETFNSSKHQIPCVITNALCPVSHPTRQIIAKSLVQRCHELSPRTL